MIGNLRSDQRGSGAYPEHVSIFQVSLGVPLLSVNEVGELGRISNEENWGVVEDPIPISFVCPQLDRKATGIASGVSRSRFASHGGEANSGADLFANRTQQCLRCDVTEVMGYFEVTVGPSTFSMDLGKEL